MNLTNKEKFIKIYSDLPLGIRQEIILTIDDKPITWNVAFIEISNDTPLSNVILKKLEKLKII